MKKAPTKKPAAKATQPRRAKKPGGSNQAAKLTKAAAAAQPARQARLGRRKGQGRAMPEVAAVEVVAVEDGGVYAVMLADSSFADKNITLYVSPDQAKTLRLEALAKGDRVLATLERQKDHSYCAQPLKKLAKAASHMVAVVEKAGNRLVLRGTDRKDKAEYELAPNQTVAFHPGDVVVADVLAGGKVLGKKQVKVTQTIGPFAAPQTVSLIAIAQHGIPWQFPETVEHAANQLQPPSLAGREDLRDIPFITIDGADARDFDDAVYASPNEKGGWHIAVAIADVAHYVPANSALDKEAFRRGNSVYFPDRVVPMLPEALSNELCSLKPQLERAALVAVMNTDAKGRLQRFVFRRAIIRSAARLTYEQAQAAIDGTPDATTAPLLKPVLEPLYAAYRTLLAARHQRGTLELDIAERVIRLREDGRIANIETRTRLDSHRLIEELMILANVSAAKALSEASLPGLYRVHDSPSVEKLENLRAFLKTFDIKLAHGKNLKPGDLAQVLEKFAGTEQSPIINEVMLRSQAQAVYSPDNIGHFGLALPRYAHFTSPIRRYADLVVHRALIRLYKLGKDGLTDAEAGQLEETAQHICFTERRAIDAERSAADRYTTLYLSSHIGSSFQGRISGVTRAGLFVRLTDSGADGFIPMASLLPRDYYAIEESAQKLRGTRTGAEFHLAQMVKVKLVEADPVVGGLRFALVGDAGAADKTYKSQKARPQKGRPQARSHRRGKRRG